MNTVCVIDTVYVPVSDLMSQILTISWAVVQLNFRWFIPAYSIGLIAGL